MKKVVRMLGLCALVALAFTSCKKEQKPTELTFTATINQPVTGDRTHIGDGDMLVWDANNTIKVFNSNGEEGDFTTTDADVTEATFTGTLTPTETYTAFYPDATVNGNAVTLSLNANQNYVANNFGNDTYPMAAASQMSGNNFNFTFHSPASVLRLVLKSDNNCTVKSIVMTGVGTDVLAGDIVYSSFGNPTDYTVANGTKVVTLDCGTGVQLAANQETAFNIVVLGGTMSAGTQFEVKDMNNNVIKTLTTAHNNTLTPEHILIMPLMEISYELPNVVTTAATSVTYQSATINGTYTFPAGAPVTSCGFYWGTDQAAVTNGTATKVTIATGTPMSYGLTGLSASTTYYFKAWGVNASGESCGSVLNFTTPAAPTPTVTTNAASAVTSPSVSGATGSATLNGTYNANGTTITEVGFYWGTTNNPTTKVIVTGSTASPFHYDLSSLAPGTYYFKAYAKTTIEYPGEVLSFTINQASVPGAFSTSATRQVVFAPANLQYNLNPNASQSSTTNPQWRFAANQWEFLGENTNVTNLWYRISMEKAPEYLANCAAAYGTSDPTQLAALWNSNHNVYWQCYYAIQTWPTDLTTAESKYWMDLFCWATSGYGTTQPQPWNVQRDNEANGTGFDRRVDYPSYGYNNYAFYSPRPGYTWYNLGGIQTATNISDHDNNYDWGIYNNIYNPRTGEIDPAGTWRTLTGSYSNEGNNPDAPNGEWYYVMHCRTTANGQASVVNGQADARWCKANINVNGNHINGLIMFPDVYVHPTGVPGPNYINQRNVSCADANTYTTAQWAAMETAGAVFLPCAGYRFGWGKYEIVHDPNYGVTVPTAPNSTLSRAYTDNTQGYYWSSTSRHSVSACDVRIMSNADTDFANVDGGNTYNRDSGIAVRLAKTVRE